MAQERLGGHGARMRPAVKFAEENGITYSFTKKQHIQFRGPDGRIVIASGTPRNDAGVARVMGQLRNLLKPAAGQPR